MNIDDLCRQIAKTLKMPREYHIAAVFSDNDSDEVIGWCILDGENNILSEMIQTENLPNWESYILENSDDYDGDMLDSPFNI